METSETPMKVRKAARIAKTAALITLVGAIASACGAQAAARHTGNAAGGHRHPSSPTNAKTTGVTKTPTQPTQPTQTPQPKQPTQPTRTTQPTEPPPPPASPSPILETNWGTPSTSIPWNEVGAAWTLVLWNPVVTGPQSPVSPARPTILYLVSPAGTRYEEAVVKPGVTATIADWSGDKQRALLTNYVGNPYTYTGTTSLVTDLDLVNGQTVSSFALDNLTSATFTLPTGTGLLIARNHDGSGPTTLTRYQADGTPELTFPSHFSEVGTYSASSLYTPDGTQLVLGAQRGLALVSNDGSIVRQLPVAGAAGGCQVVRFEAPGVVLADCGTSGGSYFYEYVPLSGAPVTRGPASPMPRGWEDNLWQVPSGTYGQRAACGIIWIVKLDATGNWDRIELPGVDQSESQFVIGTYGDELETVATPSCASPRNPAAPSVMFYDPVHGKTTVLIGTTVNGGSVQSALPYGEPLIYA